jgi:hypothetical protein
MKPQAPEKPDREPLPADSPLLLDSILARLRKDYGAKADPWASAASFVASRIPDPRMPEARGAPLFSNRTVVFFMAAAALFYLRMMHRTTYFPIFVEGEESKVLDLAKATVDYASYMGSWWSAFTGGLIEYNKGFAWFLVPFYLLFGYDVRIMAFVLPAIYCVLVGAFFTIYRKANPGGSLLSFVVVAMTAALCVSLRRYKWQSVAYIPALSIYIYFLPLFHAGAGKMKASWRKGIATALFVFSCYLYFGCLLFAVPFFILVVVLGTGAERRREILGALAGSGLCTLVFLAMYSTAESWHQKVVREIASLRYTFTHTGLAPKWWSTRDFFFTQDLTLPYLAIFIVGAAVSWRRIRSGDTFAMVNTALLSCLWAFQVSIGGLNDADQMNWSMVPFMGLMLMGCDAIVLFLKSRLRFGLALAVAATALACWNEQRHYLVLNRDAPYQAFIHDRDTRSQIALIIRMIREDDKGSVAYFLPDAATPASRGGFNTKAALARVDAAPAFARVTYFRDEEDLRGQLAALPRGRKAVAFLSVGFPAEGTEDTLYLPLLGEAPEIIHPYETIYGIPFLVRKFTFETGIRSAPP